MNALLFRLLSSPQAFRTDRRGNASLMTALAMMPVLLVLGGAVDYARVTTAQTQLSTALESGVLAAASLTQTGDPEAVMREYIASNMSGNRAADSVQIEIIEATDELNKNVMIVQATAEVPTLFLRLANIDKIDVISQSAAMQSSSSVEIALVLDISSSMNGNRLSNLKAAAPSFIDQMLDDEGADYTSINLIPFGGTVNIGDALFNEFTPTDPNPGDDSDGVITNPNQAQYDIGAGLIDDGFRFTDGDSCIEYHKDDFSETIIPANSRSQLPHFWKWNNFNPWCPEDESQIILNTNDAPALKDRIAEMTLSDGTGMDIGTLWATKSLSPTWRGKLGGEFPDRPLDYDESTLKIAVLMTDGGITNQVRPEDIDFYSSHIQPWPHTKNRNKITNKSPDYRDENEQQILKKGSQDDDLTDTSAVGYFNHLCDTMKANGVIIYTIGFQIKDGSAQDYYLEKCATTPGYYYFVESLDIQAAFDSIAASISSLRITG